MTIESDDVIMNEFFVCQCQHSAHTLRFSLLILGSGQPELELDVHMTHYLPWYHRVWEALKYVLGIESGNYHYDGWMLRPEDADRLSNMLTRYLRLASKTHEDTPT